MPARYSNGGLNTKLPFEYQTSKSLLFRCFHYSDVRYPDPHCNFIFLHGFMQPNMTYNSLHIYPQHHIQWDLNTDHLNIGNILMPNIFKCGFQMVRYSNGWSMVYVLCNRPTIGIPDQYIRKQDGI